MTELERRRRDHQLRSAIDRIQHTFNGLKDCDKLYEITLHEVLKLTSANFGFVVERGIDFGSDSGCLVVLSHSLTSSGAESSRFKASSELSFLLNVFRSGNADTFSRAEISSIPCAEYDWPVIKSLFALPLVEDGKVVALICVANSNLALQPSSFKRFWPLLTCVVFARRSLMDRGRKRVRETFSSDLMANPQETLNQIEDSCPIGVVEINQFHKIVRMNPAAEKIFGTEACRAANRDIADYIPERYPNEHQTRTFAQRTKINSEKVRFLAHREDKRTVPVDISVILYQVKNQKHFMLMIQDMSDLLNAKEKQVSQEKRYKAVTDLAPVGILQLDRNWSCIYANNQWCDTCDMPRKQVLGTGWINAFHQSDVEETLNELYTAIRKGIQFKHTCRLRTQLGQIIWIDIYARPTYDESGTLTEIIVAITDVTYRHTTEQKLRNMAEKDALTGLVNRALLLDRLACAQTRIERHGPLALLSLDLDGFKTINDSLGHDAGDMLLREVATRIRQCVRSEDTVARMGGDEFMVLIEGLEDSSSAARVSTNILKALSKPFLVMRQEIYISASIGISFCLTEQISESNIMKQADIALYRAKDQGKNNFQYYSPELEQASKEWLALSTQLHQALARNEFELFFQLQAQISTGLCIGTEALLRWRHPERGILAPASFLNILEETGLILDVGEWIITESCRQFRHWLDQGTMNLEGHISVNFSPKQLRDDRAVKTLKKALQKYQLPGEVFFLEITESALLEASETTMNVLMDLKGLGVHIALDDFGTGYSSLTYLKRFPIDFVKIDRSFVENIMKDKNDGAITHAVITLAHSLGIKAIAEGVEDEHQLAKLEQFGCHYYQGHLLNKACHATEVEQLLLTPS